MQKTAKNESLAANNSMFPMGEWLHQQQNGKAKFRGI
jgi:hypothetical protein